MQYRRFGRTGLEISAFTVGGGWVGGILVDPPEDIRLAALERAIAAGCNWIDTAASYGQGESERAIGRLLPKLTPRPHVSTKFAIDPTSPEPAESQIRRSLEASLERLRADRVTLLQLHNKITRGHTDKSLAPVDILHAGGVADILDALREEGLFDHIGITALGDAPAIVETLSSGRFDTAQVYANMLNPSAFAAMPAGWRGQDFAGVGAACAAQDVGVMNIRVLAAGVLATDRRHGREIIVTDNAEIVDEEARAGKVVATLRDGHGTRAQAAIRYNLANPAIHTIVVGMASLAHLDEALAAFEAGPLDAAVRERIAAVQAMFA